MTYSKILSALTAMYGVFALAKPRHLATGIEAPDVQAPAYDQMARTYAGRDLSISGLALASSSPALVTTAMALRIAGDLSDAAVLGLGARSSKVRTKVLAVTLGWAALNTAALLADRRGLGR